MSRVSSGSRSRRRLTVGVKDSLRELRIQLALLNRLVGAQVKLKELDWDCLDIVTRCGPISPSALARRAGLHPATTTGVLDRLERADWIARERDGTDRRGVTVRARSERSREVFRLYAGMNRAMNEICAGYTEAELELVADFLRRTTDAGLAAVGDLTGNRAAG